MEEGLEAMISLVEDLAISVEAAAASSHSQAFQVEAVHLHQLRPRHSLKMERESLVLKKQL